MGHVGIGGSQFHQQPEQVFMVHRVPAVFGRHPQGGETGLLQPPDLFEGKHMVLFAGDGVDGDGLEDGAEACGQGKIAGFGALRNGGVEGRWGGGGFTHGRS